jgi:hypothetical protein
MEVEKNGPQREHFGEHRRVSGGRLCRLKERGADPFADRLFAGERLDARVLLGVTFVPMDLVRRDAM